MKKIIVLLFMFSVATFAAVNTATCVGCHGKNFEKSAMNKSKIVADMPKDEVSKALIGYKNGTYGGSMKNMMKMQVAKYSDEELQDTNIGKKSFTKHLKNADQTVFTKTKEVAIDEKKDLEKYLDDRNISTTNYNNVFFQKKVGSKCLDHSGFQIAKYEIGKKYKYVVEKNPLCK